MNAEVSRGRCKRCGRRIVLRKPGQEYGPKCARYFGVEVIGELELLPSLEDQRRGERGCGVSQGGEPE